MDREQAAALASELLGMPLDDALASATELPQIDAFHCCERFRGGRQLIVGRDGSVLFGISAWSPQKMVEDWLAGRRTDRARFRRD